MAELISGGAVSPFMVTTTAELISGVAVSPFMVTTTLALVVKSTTHTVSVCPSSIRTHCGVTVTDPDRVTLILYSPSSAPRTQ